MEFTKAELKLMSYALHARLTRIEGVMYVLDYVQEHNDIHGWQREVLPKGLSGLSPAELIEQKPSWQTLHRQYTGLLERIGKPNTI